MHQTWHVAPVYSRTCLIALKINARLISNQTILSKENSVKEMDWSNANI